MAYSPSYIVRNRYGIYYFQLRKPDYQFDDGSCGQKLIRKSLRTRDRKVALGLARKYWLLYMSMSQLEEIEQIIEYEKDLLACGRKRYEEYWREQLSMVVFDELLIDYYLDPTFNSPFKIEAFQFYAAKYQEAYTSQYRSGELEKKLLPSTNNEKSSASATVEQAIRESSSSGIVAKDSISDMKLSEVVNQWIYHNTKLKQRSWSASSQKKFSVHLRLFTHLLDDPLAASLSKEMIRERFLKIFPQLPANIRTQRQCYQKGAKPSTEVGEEYRHLQSISDIIEITKREGLKKTSQKALSDYSSNITTFLRWAARQDYINSAMDVVLEDYAKFNSSHVVDAKEKAFTETDLQRLFQSPEYQQGQLFRYPYRHWIGLILLYTGARLGEIAQLRLDQIIKDEPTKSHFFSITDAAKGQTIKTESSRRKVPIHEDLVKLGFLTYVDQRRQAGEEQLFARMQPDSNGNWGRPYSRWFNGQTVKGKRRTGYLESCGIGRLHAEKNTKSFRHYLANRTKQQSAIAGENQLNYEVWCEITGHSSGQKTVRKQVYESDFDIKTLVIEMNKLRFDFIAIDSIKRWK